MKDLIGKLRDCGAASLLLVIIFLSAATKFFVGKKGIDGFHFFPWPWIGFLLLFFLFVLFVLDLADSLIKVRHHVDPETRQVQVISLWREVRTNPLSGMIVFFIMLLGVANAQYWSEYYRQHVSHWHDSLLWKLESGLFAYLQESFLNIPFFWDIIYLSFWFYIVLVFAILYKACKFQTLATLTIATTISFYLTRLTAICFPTAGPVFYRPEFFDLAGTASRDMQEMLISYMNGELFQNGFVPGTMAMPSLHVGLTFLATFYLARHVAWSLFLTLPWSCLVWASTVMLGWHYVLDGLGGIVIVVISTLFPYGLARIGRLRTAKSPIAIRQMDSPKL